MQLIMQVQPHPFLAERETNAGTSCMRTGLCMSCVGAGCVQADQWISFFHGAAVEEWPVVVLGAINTICQSINNLKVEKRVIWELPAVA